MATVAKFEEILGRAEECAKAAVGYIASTQGSARGPLQAQLAAMWLARATLEHNMIYTQRLERELSRLRERVRALEKVNNITSDEPAMPDPFDDDEIATVGV